jgi:hypothetical protein
VFCRKCGAEIGDKATFCGKCGHPLGNASLPVFGESTYLNQSHAHHTRKKVSIGKLIVIVVLIAGITTGIAAFINYQDTQAMFAQIDGFASALSDLNIDRAADYCTDMQILKTAGTIVEAFVPGYVLDIGAFILEQTNLKPRITLGSYKIREKDHDRKYVASKGTIYFGNNSTSISLEFEMRKVNGIWYINRVSEL